MLVFSFALYAQPDADVTVIPNGFLKGADFLALSDSQRHAYAKGFADGLLSAGLLDAPNAKIDEIQKCFIGMSDQQMAAILLKWLKDHPENWHHSMTQLGMQAMAFTCKIKWYKPKP